MHSLSFTEGECQAYTGSIKQSLLYIVGILFSKAASR